MLKNRAMDGFRDVFSGGPGSGAIPLIRQADGPVKRKQGWCCEAEKKATAWAVKVVKKQVSCHGCRSTPPAGASSVGRGKSGLQDPQI